LLHMGVLLLEVIGEAEGHDWQTGVVVCAGLAFFALIGLALLVLELALGAVDVAHAAVPAGGFERFRQKASVRERVFHDAAVAFEAKVNEVVVLCDDLGSRAGEVEGEGFFGATCGRKKIRLVRLSSRHQHRVYHLPR